MHLVANFDLCSITNEFSHSSPTSNVVKERIDKLTVGFERVNIADHRFGTNEKLRARNAGTNGGGVGIDGIRGDRFAASMYVARRERRFEVSTQLRARRFSIELRSAFERFLNNFGGGPGKLGTVTFKVNFSRLNLLTIKFKEVQRVGDDTSLKNAVGEDGFCNLNKVAVITKFVKRCIKMQDR